MYATCMVCDNSNAHVCRRLHSWEANPRAKAYTAHACNATHHRAAANPAREQTFGAFLDGLAVAFAHAFAPVGAAAQQLPRPSASQAPKRSRAGRERRGPWQTSLYHWLPQYDYLKGAPSSTLALRYECDQLESNSLLSRCDSRGVDLIPLMTTLDVVGAAPAGAFPRRLCAALASRQRRDTPRPRGSSAARPPPCRQRTRDACTRCTQRCAACKLHRCA